MLPWDVWGAIPQSKRSLEEEELAFFDRLAELTRAGDGSLAELQQLYEFDERLRVPRRVFNAMRGQLEEVDALA